MKTLCYQKKIELFERELALLAAVQGGSLGKLVTIYKPAAAITELGVECRFPAWWVWFSCPSGPQPEGPKLEGYMQCYGNAKARLRQC